MRACGALHQWMTRRAQAAGTGEPVGDVGRQREGPACWTLCVGPRISVGPYIGVGRVDGAASERGTVWLRAGGVRAQRKDGTRAGPAFGIVG